MSINFGEMIKTGSIHSEYILDTHEICQDDYIVEYPNWDTEEVLIVDEQQWLLCEIEKTKLDTHVKRYETLIRWVDICNEHNLLAEVATLTKKYINDYDTIVLAMNAAMYEWDI